LNDVIGTVKPGIAHESSGYGGPYGGGSGSTTVTKTTYTTTRGSYRGGSDYLPESSSYGGGSFISSQRSGGSYPSSSADVSGYGIKTTKVMYGEDDGNGRNGGYEYNVSTVVGSGGYSGGSHLSSSYSGSSGDDYGSSGFTTLRRTFVSHPTLTTRYETHAIAQNRKS
uniref:Pro-resilin n=1 Tax=Syphacia muris TaxID=451379 RepID=A0A0N5ARN2_9BILA